MLINRYIEGKIEWEKDESNVGEQCACTKRCDEPPTCANQNIWTDEIGNLIQQVCCQTMVNLKMEEKEAEFSYILNKLKKIKLTDSFIRLTSSITFK